MSCLSCRMGRRCNDVLKTLSSHPSRTVWVSSISQQSPEPSSTKTLATTCPLAFTIWMAQTWNSTLTARIPRPRRSIIHSKSRRSSFRYRRLTNLIWPRRSSNLAGSTAVMSPAPTSATSRSPSSSKNLGLESEPISPLLTNYRVKGSKNRRSKEITCIHTHIRHELIIDARKLIVLIC